MTIGRTNVGDNVNKCKQVQKVASKCWTAKCASKMQKNKNVNKCKQM